ncbi:sensor domain-containing protein [Pseudokineococcus lusitanus]|uniref:PAS domain S-box-containing protein/diguanylate cyclase (GGDEF)-like protein n=1 Tax=Pseudokineococcus lusitanus TaxID=763993 RepID=A0A3N1HR52_9ACTN|nr:GGDEF domain-containing protein [Pseudokineococcus lusitanus]ROP44998.1 PAS domain S-box-containing protein/diguanylate cyclase (GGDEF)-like protein [Pseudokineococcus lusitanus]
MTTTLEPSADASPEGRPPRADEADRLRELYDDAPCGYLTTADDGTITRVNATFCAWAGYTAEELLGTRLPRLLPVGDRILWSASCLPRLRATGAVAETMVEVIAADRSRRAVLLSATLRPAADGVPAEIRVIVLAAHERRRHERDLVDALRRAQEAERQRVAVEEEMRQRALRDDLTGLPNRAGLLARLAGAPEGGRPASAGTALLFVGLDHFKAVNDSLGREAGDELLRVVAQRLTATVRADGVVARLSGDEFVVVADVGDDGAARAVAERVLDVVTAPVLLQDVEIVVTASVGVVRATPDETPERLLHHADVAMHRAKARGRARVELHDPDVVDPAVGRLRLIGELRRGIAEGELRVHYQPRMDLRGDRVAGVEALVRWQHPERGLLQPGDFIDVAEESGLVRRLGAWVLDSAVAQGAAWARTAGGGPTTEIAVNLSTRQLGDPDLVPLVAEVLDRHGLDPALLTLEVTETALMEDPDAAAATLRALKALGVTLAVDDFGTGYASLTYLQRFPLDELKIDRSFVAGLTESRGDAAIVATCVHLAHSLGLRAVAEGVETPDQRRALEDLDCDMAQGYHYARPLPVDELDRWCAAR